jgi:hypothetical protein
MERINRYIFLAIFASLTPSYLYAEGSSPRFQEYEITDVYQGKKHPAVLITPQDRKFRTMLRTAADEKVNFAGHYIVKTFGAGACGVMGFVMDAKTGRAVWFPYADIACADPHYGEPVRFDLHSRLIVFQGQLNETEPNGEYYFDFRDGKFIPVAVIPLPGPYPVQQLGNP